MDPRPTGRRTSDGIPGMTTNEADDRQVYTIAHVLGHFPQIDEVTKAHLQAALIDREDAIVTVLHLAGVQFGLFPQIVAEVLAEVGLGTPKSDAEREMIRRSFLALMEELRRAQT